MIFKIRFRKSELKRNNVFFNVLLVLFIAQNSFKYFKKCFLFNDLKSSKEGAK